MRPGWFRRLLPVGRLGWHRVQRLDELAVQHAGLLVETDDRKARVIGPLVDGQNVFHVGNKGRVQRPQVSPLLAVGRPFVF